jgi:succinate dehydrogenase / fumarate reductase flavoprotein subunit/fumarate reductase flavoprotein subunit
MAKRFLQFGYDVARDRVPLAPSAQLFMGGAVVDSSCRSSLERLFVAGEDASGIHGANRHGGNGIAAACVFGRQAGKSIAEYLSNEHRTPEETSPGQIKETAHLLSQPFHHLSGGCPFELCRELQILNWNKVGVVREQSELDKALAEIDAMHEAAQNLKVTGAANYNHTFAAALDLRSMIDISRIVAASATLRQETRGAHARLEFAEQRDDHGLFNTYARRDENHQLKLETKAVEFKYRSLAECQHHQKKNKIKRGGTLNNAMSKGGSADGTTDAGRRS